MRRIVFGALLGIGFLGISGCEAAGFLAQSVAPDPAPLKVKAEYLGLDNQSVAVLVDAPQSLLFDQPLAQLEIGMAISEQIAVSVPGVKLIDAHQIVDFQNRNIYWNTIPFSQIAQRLGVQRLVLVELMEYRLHEPGNVNIWRGVIIAQVSVVEEDGVNPNDRVYDRRVVAAYPPDAPHGVLNANQRELRFGTVDLFSRSVAGLFMDHKEARDQR